MLCDYSSIPSFTQQVIPDHLLCSKHPSYPVFKIPSRKNNNNNNSGEKNLLLGMRRKENLPLLQF